MSGNEFKIAIIGMAGVFPDSDSITELWQSLLDKKILVRKYEEHELSLEFQETARRYGASFLPFRGTVNDANCFDHEFFKMSLTDAIETDPQQRILLQVAYNALRDSGNSPEQLSSRNVGVYASCSPVTYHELLNQSRSDTDIMSSVGCLRDLIASRISYALNLHGPAVNVQTGCSSSMSAIYEASKALLSNECSLALVGGSSIRFPQNGGHVFQEGGIYSRDGLCRPFEERSSGTVSGNGCAAIILKRYEDAVADGDRIYCAINTILANNDGSRKASIAAPSVDGQNQLISEVLSISGVHPDEVAFVEAHGTATALGDAVELEALSRAFKSSAGQPGCALGSIKANIGHLDSTSGIAATIKAALSLYTGIYPAHPSFVNPNPVLRMEDGPFFINQENLPLPDAKKYGAVNSLGIGGTNVFALLEKVHSLSPSVSEVDCFYPVRIKEPNQVAAWARTIKNFLTLNPQVLSSLSAEVGPGNKISGFLVRRKNGILSTLVSKNILKFTPQKIVMVFPGGGSYYRNALTNLALESSSIQKHLDDVLAILKGTTEHEDIVRFFSGRLGEGQYERIALDPCQNLLISFIINHVCAVALLQSGVKPYLLIGHSLGEYNALVLSGRIELQDALKIVRKRGEIFSRIKGFRILNLGCGTSTLEKVSSKAHIIAYNGSENLSVVLPESEFDAFCEGLIKDSIPFSQVSIHVPAHSHFLDPYLAEFREFLQSFTFMPGSIPVVSNITGKILAQDQLDYEYLANHLREPVRFSQGIQSCISHSTDTFVQVGVGFGLVAEITGSERLNTLSSLGSDPDSEGSTFLILEKLLTLKKINPVKAPLPAYPFLKKKCWPTIIASPHTFHQAVAYVEVISPVRSRALLNNAGKGSNQRFSSFEVLPWEQSVDDVPALFDLVGELRKIDQHLVGPKLIYLVRRKGERPDKLLGLRSLVASFNIESSYLGVKILSLSEEVKDFDFASYHSRSPNLECAYVDQDYEYAPSYALYAPVATAELDRGDVLIVGGLGRVGKRLSEKLILENKRKLILCGRSDFTTSELQSKLADSPLLISAINQGRLVYRAIKNGSDLAELVRTNAALESLIFSASASELDSIRRSVVNLQLEDLYEQMESKSILYQEYLQDMGSNKSPKVIFISSNASRLSGPGMMAYAYANAQIDQLSLRDPQVSSICFDAFRFSGESLPMVRNYTDADGLLAAYHLAHQAELGLNLILSNQLFAERINEWVRKKVSLAVGPSSVPDIARSRVVDVVAQVFGDMLGFDSNQKDMDFFHSGGHSLLAFRVLGKLNSLYGIRLSMKDLKLNSTPEKLDVIIESLLKKKSSVMDVVEESLDIDNLLAEFE